MDIYTAGPEGVAVYAPEKTDLTPAEAGELVRRALEESGLPVWESVEADIYCGCGGCLVLARPGQETRVYIADYALPFLPEL